MRVVLSHSLLWPPASYAGCRPFCFTAVVQIFLLPIFSPPNLRGRLAERHQTLPHGRRRPRFIKFDQVKQYNITDLYVNFICQPLQILAVVVLLLSVGSSPLFACQRYTSHQCRLDSVEGRPPKLWTIPHRQKSRLDSDIEYRHRHRTESVGNEEITRHYTYSQNFNQLRQQLRVQLILMEPYKVGNQKSLRIQHTHMHHITRQFLGKPGSDSCLLKNLQEIFHRLDIHPNPKPTACKHMTYCNRQILSFLPLLQDQT